MQAEAGQALPTILRRKELERAAGNGLFYWGIGNALGTRVLELVHYTDLPDVFFSIMPSKPKRIDADPSSVVCWSEYYSLDGRRAVLPPRALVLSRGNTSAGKKDRHYALVCQLAAPLSANPIGYLDIAHCRNLGSSNPNVGFSQVTAVLEHQGNSMRSGKMYEIVLRATLVPPYFVRLSRPIELHQEAHATLKSFVASDPDPEAWRQFACDFRNDLGAA
jgi:hypothetical protein